MRLTNDELESIMFDFSSAYKNENVPESQIFSPERRKEEYNEWSKKDDILYEAINKLGQLEDIEEELGIELVTLFKAFLNNEFYAINPYGFDTEVKIVECHGVNFEKSDYKGYAIGGYFSLPSELFNHCSWSIKDYGKTWALTKEELE